MQRGFYDADARAPKPRSANGGHLHDAAIKEQRADDEKRSPLRFETPSVGGREEERVGAQESEMERNEEEENVTRGWVKGFPTDGTDEDKKTDDD